MNIGIQHLHHYLPYIFLLVLIVSILRAAFNKIPNVKKDKILLATLILAHIQLLLGLYLYLPNAIKMGIMYSEDHPVSMILGIIILTIGKLISKKIEDNTKANKTIFISFLIAAILIISRSADKLF
jgi:hypothetical protein